MSEKIMKQTGDEQLFSQIKRVLDDARRKVARTVNTTIVNAYWQVGKYIVEYEQQGKGRAEFGKDIINKLSKRLMKEYGGGFSAANLRYMRQFYMTFPICHSLSDKLTWTHWRALLRVQNEEARIRFMLLNI